MNNYGDVVVSQSWLGFLFVPLDVKKVQNHNIYEIYVVHLQ